MNSVYLCMFFGGANFLIVDCCLFRLYKQLFSDVGILVFMDRLFDLHYLLLGSTEIVDRHSITEQCIDIFLRTKSDPGSLKIQGSGRGNVRGLPDCDS